MPANTLMNAMPTPNSSRKVCRAGGNNGHQKGGGESTEERRGENRRGEERVEVEISGEEEGMGRRKEEWRQIGLLTNNTYPFSLT